MQANYCFFKCADNDNRYSIVNKGIFQTDAVRISQGGFFVWNVRAKVERVVAEGFGPKKYPSPITLSIFAEWITADEFWTRSNFSGWTWSNEYGFYGHQGHMCWTRSKA